MTHVANGGGIALVTGGTGGIGAATCRVLAASGDDVAFTYWSNHAGAAALVEEIESHGVRANAEQIDLVDPDSVSGWVDRIVNDWGPVNKVVHAAGPYIDMLYISQVTPEKFRSHIDAELMAFFNLSIATIPVLRDTAGSITAVTSVAVRQHPVKDILSGAPKGAIEVLVRGIAREEGKFGVRANSVAPGVITGDSMGTALLESGDFDAASQEYALARTPMRRWGQPEEIADVVAFVASDRASYLSGQAINVDGGFTA